MRIPVAFTAVTAVGISITSRVTLCLLLLPVCQFSQTNAQVLSSDDLLKTITSLADTDKQRAIELIAEYGRFADDAFFGALILEAEKARASKSTSRALFLLQVADAAAEGSGKWFVRANALQKIGKLRYEQQQLKQAIESYQLCVRICRESEQKASASRLPFMRLLATALYELGRAQFETGDLRNAIVSYDESLSAFQDINSKLDCIRILNDLGTLYINTGDYNTAKEVSQRSLSLTTSLFAGNESSSYSRYFKAIAWSNLGYISTWEGDYRSAVDFLVKSLLLFEAMVKAGEPYLQAVADRLIDLGQVFHALGNYTKSLSYYSQALARIEASNLVVTRQRLYTSLGILYLDQGDYPKANEFLDQSLMLASQAGNKTAVATVLNNIGVSNQRQGRYEAAFGRFQEALKLARAIEATSLIIPSLEGLGTISQAQRNYDAALLYFDQAMTASRKLGDKSREAELLWRESVVHTLCADYRQALALADKALILAREMRQPNISYLALVSRARASLAQDQYDLALQSLTDAIGEAELIRRNVAGLEEQSTLFFQNRIEPYYLMVDLLAKQNRIEDALLYSERAKGRVLLDVLRGNRATAASEMSASDREKEQKLKKEIQQLNIQIYKVSQEKQPDSRTVSDLSARLYKARLEYEAFQDNLYARDPDRRAQRVETKSISIEDFQLLLPDTSTALLEFAVLEEKTYVFVATRDAGESRGRNQINIKLYPIPVRRDELTSMVEAFISRIATRSIGIQRLASDLYKLLVRPARDQLAGKTALVLSPDSILWELPFQALQSSSAHYLIEDFSISYAPSLNVLSEIVKKSRAKKTKSEPGSDLTGARHSLLAFGNPALGAARKTGPSPLRDNNLYGLPEAEREVRAIAGIYGYENSNVLIGPVAREETAKSQMGQYRILHFATHSILDNQGPMYSRIVLSQDDSDSNEDGLLEAWEIANLDLQADIAVLSACETARGQIRAGEGVIGLCWALFVAGCPAAVVSQWKVESAGTTEMMIEFHRNLFSSMKSPDTRIGKSEALRLAALKMLKSERYRDPFYWASFVIVGDGR